MWWETVDRDIETFGSSVCKLPADTASTDSRTVDAVDVAREASTCRFREQRRARFLGHDGCPFQVTRDSAFRDVFARFGFPVNVYVATDNGQQFISAEFGEFLRRNGVKHIRVAPYHPASNGAAERMVQSFKRSVKASASTAAPMSHRLADFLLTYWTTPHAITGRTASIARCYALQWKSRC